MFSHLCIGRKGHPKRLARIHSPEPGNLIIAEGGTHQPVDFSQSTSTSLTGTRPKGSILGTVLYKFLIDKKAISQ